MEPVYKKLRRFNMIMGLLHLVQGCGDDLPGYHRNPENRRIFPHDHTVLPDV